MGHDAPMKTLASLTRPSSGVFSEALSKVVSIPRAEMQKHMKIFPEVPVSRAGGLGLDTPKTTPRVPAVSRIWGPGRLPTLIDRRGPAV
jgi:hypothetical protein